MKNGGAAAGKILKKGTGRSPFGLLPAEKGVYINENKNLTPHCKKLISSAVKSEQIKMCQGQIRDTCDPSFSYGKQINNNY